MENWADPIDRSAHHPTLKRVVRFLEEDFDRVRDGLVRDKRPYLEQKFDLRGRMRHMVSLVEEAGRQWAHTFIPGGTKVGIRMDWDVDKDIDAITRSVGEIPSTSIRDAAHRAIRRGGGATEAVHALAQDYQIDRARDVARTVYMNVYAKSALREMRRHGYSIAKRIEIDDTKVCPLCRALNNGTYDIDDLLASPNPLTRGTHPRCRGTFVPVINSMIALPQRSGKYDHVTDINSNGNEIEDAPVEYAVHLRRFSDSESLPFRVVFDPKLPVSSRMGAGELRVHPSALYDQDPRELILEEWAEQLWPKYRDIFSREYLTLSGMGLVRPHRTVSSVEEYWRSAFVAHKLRQVEGPWEWIWFKTNVKE